VPERILALDPSGLAQAADRAVAAWRAGGLVAFPTETVYGLGAAARSPAAVARVFAAKGRPADHPLIVHLADADQVDGWARDVPPSARRLAEAAWPGPLTLVLHRRHDVAAAVTGGQPTIALRVPGHPVALALLRAFGDGIAAPSANRFGRVSPTSADHVLADLGHVVGLIVVDGGPCDLGIESTIVDLTGPRAVVRRLGGLGRDAIEAALGEAVLEGGAAGAGQAPRVPGALARHYAPATPARAVAVGAGERAPRDVAVLARRAAPPGRSGPWAVLPGEPAAAGRALYRVLRELDAAGARELWLEAVPTAPGWAAIADRLARAVVPAPRVGAAPEEGT
jgi:L-threonylcarbamoyladenylate synthase